MSNSNPSKAAAEQDEIYDYNLLVKKRLIKWRKEFEEAMGGLRLNYSAIVQQMEKRFGINTTTTKVAAMFDETSTRTIQLQELVALAQLFDIPLWNICEHPTLTASNRRFDYGDLLRKKAVSTASVRQLSDSLYDGEYWCYFFRPRHTDGYLMPVAETRIIEAKMSIHIEQGRTVLTLSYYNTSQKFDGQPMPPMTLCGDLYHFTNTDIAYSFVSDPDNRRGMALMFTYLNLTFDVRFYITAGMMTLSFNQIHNPIFQKMAIFRNRQDLTDRKNAQILRGILSLNSTPITISKEEHQKITAQDEMMREILSPNHALSECLAFSENYIQDRLINITDEYDSSEKLLEIKSRSMLPAHEIVSEIDSFVAFIKAFQVNQRDCSINDTRQ